MDAGANVLLVTLKGIVGTITPLMGFTISSMQQLEQWLRIVSLGIGILVGVATLISLIRNLRKKA